VAKTGTELWLELWPKLEPNRESEAGSTRTPQPLCGWLWQFNVVHLSH